jgi:hypothetical protein
VKPPTPRALVQDYPSNTTLTLRGGGVYRITGTTTIQTINGLKDGEELVLLPAAAFGLNSAGNLNVITSTATIDRPIHFVQMNNVLYEVGPSVGGGGAADGFNRIAAGTQTAGSATTVVFSDSNNVSFGMSGSTRITASASFAQSVQTQNLHNVTLSGNTAGVMAQISSGTLTLAGGNNITLSQAGNAVTISAGAGGAGDGLNRIAAGTQTAGTLTTVMFSNSNNVSFGMTNSSIVTASASFVAQSVQPGIQSISAGTTRATTGEVAWSNSNGLSFGMNGQTVTASHNALTSQSVQTQNFVAVVGAGANGTGTFSSGSVTLAAGSNVTLSTGANVISIHAPAGGTGGGAAPTVSFWQNAVPANTGNSNLSNAALVIWPLNVADLFPGNMTVSTMFLNLTGTVSTGSAWTRSISIGFYTQANSSQLSLLFSASTSFGSSGANASMATSFAGYRWLTIHSSRFNVQPTFSQTKYWFALWDRSSSGAQSFSYFGHSHFVHTSVRSGFINAASNSATTQGWHPFNGNYSVSFSTAMPSVINASDINKTGATAVANFIPNIIFGNLASNII